MAKLLGHEIVTTAELEDFKTNVMAPLITRLEAAEKKIASSHQRALVVALVVSVIAGIVFHFIR